MDVKQAVVIFVLAATAALLAWVGVQFPAYAQYVAPSVAGVFVVLGGILRSPSTPAPAAVPKSPRNSVVPLSIVALAVMASGHVTACAHMTALDDRELAADSVEQGACIEAHKPDKAAIDACRAAVKAKWCAILAAKFDGGVCQ